LHEYQIPVLSVEDLIAGYGKKQVLNGISLNVNGGEIVGIIGHNGAGKSTLLKTIFGLLPMWSGSISAFGKDLSGIDPRELRSLGLSYIPQGARVFSELTVRENLEIGGLTLAKERLMKERIESVLALFPLLINRMKSRAGLLSGGEKQMLSLSMALLVHPRMILLDEPSLGLASPLVADTFARLQQIRRDTEVSMLIIEQKVRELLKIADRVYVLRNGIISYSGFSDSLVDDARLREVYF
jgi:branched-chain amino acid transport system ATP-binding protein